MSEDLKAKDKSLTELQNSVAWSALIFIGSLCLFLYLLTFSADDKYPHWVFLAIVISMKPLFIMIVAYSGATFINDILKFLVCLKNFKNIDSN